MQRDYDKAEQECQRYKTLYDVTKEEVCNFYFFVNSRVFFLLFFVQRGFFLCLCIIIIILLPLCIFELWSTYSVYFVYVSGYSISRRR